MLEAGERLNTFRSRPSGLLRLNAARVSTAMVVRPLLPGFLAANPEVEVQVVHHNCVRFRFQGSGTIFKWELMVNGRIVEHEIRGNLTETKTASAAARRGGRKYREMP